MAHKNVDRSSPGATSPPVRPVRRWALALSVGVGRAGAVAGSLTIVALLGAWVFLTDYELRYVVAMSCLVVLTVLVVLVMFCSLAAGKVGLGDTYAHPLGLSGEGGGRPETVPPLPRELPAGGISRGRRIAYSVCLTTVAIGWIGLAAGGLERSPQVEWIDTDGGAVVHSVPIKSLSDVRSGDPYGDGRYTSRITMTVPTDHGTEDVSVEVTGDRKPEVGERVTVLYAKDAAPYRDVLVGDPEELLAELEGESFTTPGRWIFFGFWVASVAGTLALLRRDSRPGRRIRRIEPGQLALRAEITGGRVWSFKGSGSNPLLSTGHCLTLKTEDGRAGFIVEGLGGGPLAEALGRVPAWLVWNPGDRTQHFAPAVLVADEGWCLHGRITMDSNPGGRDAGSLADTSRTVRVPDLRAAWPARVTRGVLVMAFVGLFFALLMVQDGDWAVDGELRWTLAVFAASLFTWILSSVFLQATKLEFRGKKVSEPVSLDEHGNVTYGEAQRGTKKGSGKQTGRDSTAGAR